MGNVEYDYFELFFLQKYLQKTESEKDDHSFRKKKLMIFIHLFRRNPLYSLRFSLHRLLFDGQVFYTQSLGSGLNLELRI